VSTQAPANDLRANVDAATAGGDRRGAKSSLDSRPDEVSGRSCKKTPTVQAAALGGRR